MSPEPVEAGYSGGGRGGGSSRCRSFWGWGMTGRGFGAGAGPFAGTLTMRPYSFFFAPFFFAAAFFLATPMPRVFCGWGILGFFLVLAMRSLPVGS
jgi:hypothetical protein